ncbi:hypothetical protein AHMF7616_05273 [Adhaeribacter pallidiroseus]|uniref:Uncharacterized protein n=1 Tax=Adhaeribacter pallidiroseus TaxID=2072847 RepID=A0A369Q7D5_9BACT|nr:hypothetical protein AHMF7616_05197 [Adhaeribacter pallidiroseus]RDC58839.1 hypothetical protein AHMF7616_05273 [Adhaeribacter pallidiroseus]
MSFTKEQSLLYTITKTKDVNRDKLSKKLKSYIFISDFAVETKILINYLYNN